MARSKRWYWAVGGELLGEIDRVGKALGLDRADVVRQAVQGGLTLLGEVHEDHEDEAQPQLTVNEVNTPPARAATKVDNTWTPEQLAALGIGPGPVGANPFGSDDA